MIKFPKAREIQNFIKRFKIQKFEFNLTITSSNV